MYFVKRHIRTLTIVNRLRLQTGNRAYVFLLLLFCFASTGTTLAQCQGAIGEIASAAVCTAHNIPPASAAQIDPERSYRLEELIDIAESNNPRTRISWEQAKQAADRLGIARSEYYPHLAALALFGDERQISPFPKPLAPRGYVLVEVPIVEAGVGLEYDVFDFGRRAAKVDSSKALRLAAVAAFQRTNQDVAFRVVTAHYGLLTAQERLEASRQILKTAQTTQDAAEAQLAAGRATLPDVLNARAAAAQAAFDLESSTGAEGIARVTLREAIGVEPSDAIKVESSTEAPLPAAVTVSISKLVEAAVQDRPDLEALSQLLHAANDEVRQARASYAPALTLRASAAQAAIWPTANYGTLGNAKQTVWSAGLQFQWSLFDGGKRTNEVRLAASKQRTAEEELREKQDAVVREAWTAYLQFRTAVRQREAADTLLNSAVTSYDASLEAYKYGVKNLVDLVSAENQLAQARLAHVQSRSSLLVSAANLDYTTGNLLRNRSAMAQPRAIVP